MTNNNTVLADSISYVPHLQAFDLLVKQRFTELELDKLLVYIIDTVPAAAIPYLADQFDVLGYKGFRLAQTEAAQREVIKRSIELHRYKGTLWAVREALTSIGYGAAIIQENVDGAPYTFRITIDLGTQMLSESSIEDIEKMIDEYKNIRSHLLDLSYTINFGDDITITDSYVDGEAETNIDTVMAGGDFRHNGLELRDGTRNYSTDTDVLTIEII
jgi:phage tail P2-like protein